MGSWEHFIAGWVGGVAGLIVGHPWDTLKVRQQVLHTTLIVAAKKTVQFEGIRGLYKGFLFPMWLIGPSNAVFFGTYGNLLRLVDNKNKHGRPRLTDEYWKEKVFVAGCIAGIPQVTLMVPMELVKTKLQISTEKSWTTLFKVKRYKGVIDCILTVAREQGIKGLFRGFVPMFYRDVPTSGIYMLSYELLLDYKYPHDIIDSAVLKQLVGGGTAGILSWVFVVPFDVVKSRMQSDDPNFPRYKGMLDCFRKTYNTHGLGFFMKGSFAICARVFPSNAAVFLMYEQTIKLLLDVFEP